MDKEEQERQFRMAAEEAYRQEIDRYYKEEDLLAEVMGLPPIGPARREGVLVALEMEWRSVRKNTRLVRMYENGKPVARILENERGIPYFDLETPS